MARLPYIFVTTVPNFSLGAFLAFSDAAWYRLYERVMGAWIASREKYSLEWKQVRYEDTVGDLEGAMRGMLEFLALPWDDAVLTFHERTTEKASTTPSGRSRPLPTTWMSRTVTESPKD